MGAVAVQVVGSVLPASYFLLGSRLVTLTFFGEEPTPTAVRQGSWMHAGLVLSVLIGGASAVAVATARNVLSAGGEDLRRRWSAGLAIGWVAGFVLAGLVVPFLPNVSKPFGFGAVWLAVGAVTSPAAVVVTEVRARRAGDGGAGRRY